MFKDFANVWTMLGVARDLKPAGGASCAFMDRGLRFVRCSIFCSDALNAGRRSGIIIAVPEAAGQ
ncbi:hypothetical protein [Methylocystis sp. SC2]|uniref:hypothetical protein n=1 Tax=Methylocystis sp. (strain SC2) TaxID=187303 RepID=UPI00027AEE85|nr:hypothetical protein [Methylocystis sp. SC2]CCJ07620.1 Hypothetical protein BN69_2169 [Methylocystis sp. SC2]